MKSKNNKLQRQLLESKQDLLKLLKNNAENKLETNTQRAFLDTFLEAQEQLVRLKDAPQLVRSPNERQLERAEQNLKNKLTKEEIEKISQTQVELIQLIIELEELKEEVSINNVKL